jgi:hypothetical protein
MDQVAFHILGILQRKTLFSVQFWQFCSCHSWCKCAVHNLNVLRCCLCQLFVLHFFGSPLHHPSLRTLSLDFIWIQCNTCYPWFMTIICLLLGILKVRQEGALSCSVTFRPSGRPSSHFQVVGLYPSRFGHKYPIETILWASNPYYWWTGLEGPNQVTEPRLETSNQVHEDVALQFWFVTTSKQCSTDVNKILNSTSRVERK